MRTYVYRIKCGSGAAAAPPADELRCVGLGPLRGDCCRSLTRRGWISAHDAHRAFCLPEALDVDAMQSAAAVL
eukprot:4702442-Prymnesium_polylepis.1